VALSSVEPIFLELQQQLQRYLTEDQRLLIEEAYQMAAKAHEGQKRFSGDPYISHPIAVAQILAAMHMDYQSIVTALLHDVLEDTLIDRSLIAEHFGEEVAQLVESLSKLDQIKFDSRIEAQAENLRRMILAMTRDIRVILIKLADRLHNMRTLAPLPREKKQRIAKETLEIYAPIANRLGMNSFRLEFEDSGFAHLYPIRYRVLKEAVRKARGNRKEVVRKLEQEVKSRLETAGIESFKILGREKHLYGLYKKMKKKDLALSEIMDIYAVRILVDRPDTCYRVLGIIHNLYKPVHGRFKDYIAVQKINGYQSLHTTVMGFHGIPIEVQIRTEEMNQLAENGIAAHWLYKTPESAIGEAEIRARDWLKDILEIQKNAKSSKDFIEQVKIDLYPDEVYVFTPGGDILSLPNHATAVDFAYAVHTDVGNACIAAKIDRRLMPLSTQLYSGQTVEIITAMGVHPNPAWLSFVITGKARSNIRHFLKSQQNDQARAFGKRLLEREMMALSLTWDNISKLKIAAVLDDLKLERFEQLCEAVGLGNQSAPLVIRRFMDDLPVAQEFLGNPLAISGTEGMVVTYAQCCYPIPGDLIVGFLNSGRGVIIHRENCKNIHETAQLREKHILVQWAKIVEAEFSVALTVEIFNNRGILAMLASTISKNDPSQIDTSIKRLFRRKKNKNSPSLIQGS
jgi:guanosine-3',5'-bis(diphosphate) 3'-pyrophosphohydrolase